MTDRASNIRRARWASAFNKYTELSQKLAQAQAQDQASDAEAIEQLLCAQQDELLDLTSPTLAAVRIKLELMWEAELHGLDQSSEEKRLIIEDLQDLGVELGELIV